MSRFDRKRKAWFAVWVAGVVVAAAGSRAWAGQLASRPADEWVKTLESPTRIASLKIDETIAKLQLKPGDVVADIGAGSGVFDAPLAAAVTSGATRGKVYAVDIDQGLLDEMLISLVPIFLGGGARLFENLGPDPPRPQQVEATEAPGVTHIRYRF